MDQSKYHNSPYFDKHCAGCRYYACITDDIHYCSYLLVTEKRRPCPPGKACTVKLERKKKNGSAKN